VTAALPLAGQVVVVSGGTRGIGKAIYAARLELAERLGLWRIRAGARLRGYHRHAHRLTARAYTERVVQGTLTDATLSFQLHQGFHVLGVVPNYLAHDPESLGWAAVIEWRNPAFSPPPDRDQRSTDTVRRGVIPG
jgi:NAD(P)-dependent dehydrogenase (short-subunit alcohol dehydrogenase family)